MVVKIPMEHQKTHSPDHKIQTRKPENPNAQLNTEAHFFGTYEKNPVLPTLKRKSHNMKDC